MKIAFFEINDLEKMYFKEHLTGHSLKFYESPLNSETVSNIKDSEAISVFIYSKINKGVIDQLPKLKFIATRSTGFDHIDLDECKKRNIIVSNVPFYGENTVAEHTFALILSLSRNIHKAYVKTTRGDFSIEGLKGFDLKGKTMGVIGAGHIGLHVIRIAKSFGMNVLAYDISQNKFLAEVLGFDYVPLDDLLKRSDIITLHVSLNKFTHHLINKDNIKLIKKGAILINTSRGGIVDTDALIEALDKKILWGAGLDVLEGEELVKEEKLVLKDAEQLRKMRELFKQNILLTKETVVFTPHIAFYSQEALERIIETTLQNILAFSSGKPQNTV